MHPLNIDPLSGFLPASQRVDRVTQVVLARRIGLHILPAKLVAATCRSEESGQCVGSA